MEFSYLPPFQEGYNQAQKIEQLTQDNAQVNANFASRIERFKF